MQQEGTHLFSAEGGMDHEYFSELRKILVPKHTELGVLVVIFFDIALIALSFHLIFAGGLVYFLLSQLILSVVYFHSFCIVHEAGHGNVSKKKIINLIIGHYASIFAFMPFFPWKYIHREHHIWTGNIKKDPTLKNLKELDLRKKVPIYIMRITWKLWIPIAGFVQYLVFWTYPLVLKREKANSKILFECLFSVLFIFFVYVFLYFGFPAFFNVSNLWLSLVLFFLLNDLINIPHHVGTALSDNENDKLPLWRQSVTTRSAYYPFPMAECLFLNFNFHIEHHTFPHLPWWMLRKVRSLIKDKTVGYRESIWIQWNLENRKKDLINMLPDWYLEQISKRGA